MKPRFVPIGHYFLRSFNPIIRILIISDIILLSGTGLLGPVFSIFIVDFIEEGTVAVAGVAATVFLLTKSLLQLPIAMFIDRVRGEKDDYWIMVIGSLGAAIVPILYLFIRTPLQLYGVQLLYGALSAMTFPSYMALFTRHIDKKREGVE